jgi:hypothetical protein
MFVFSLPPGCNIVLFLLTLCYITGEVNSLHSSTYWESNPYRPVSTLFSFFFLGFLTMDERMSNTNRGAVLCLNTTAPSHTFLLLEKVLHDWLA